MLAKPATTADDVAPYVKANPSNGIFRYYRRVPVEIARFDRRHFIKQSLKTKSLPVALQRAITVHDACEALWASLARGAEAASSFERYDAAVKLARSLGFVYRPASDVADGPIEDLLRRVETAVQYEDASLVGEAVLGAAPVPEHRLSDLWGLYETHNADGLLGMSERQLAKHRVSRERAINYLIALIGDKRLQDVDRADALAFRKWWLEKIIAEGLTAYAANRSMNDLRGMLRVVDAALRTDYWSVWQRVRVKETNATKMQKRPPFSRDWVRDKILAADALDGLDLEARCIVLAMVETGMRPSEICNLRPEDIRLDHEIPHVAIAERSDRRQKSDYSVREVPLVGVSLWAMKQCPEGFARYRDQGDMLSDTVNHYLTTQKLKQTPRHTLYSLRHTFQDRIENAPGTSERMQADLMGHEYKERPVYGEGSELRRRHEFLSSIAFDVAWLDA